MKNLFLICLLFLCPQLALAQSQRNPCAYLGSNSVASLQGNCLPIGFYLAGATGVPMPVGGIANVAAPTFTEAKPGYLSFDLNGNLRVISSGGGGGGAVTIADGADVAEGATTDAASTAGGIGTVSSKLRLMTTQLGTINTTLGSPFQAGGALAANQSVNISQINGITPLMGNGVTGTGSQRVTIASDNTAFSVNATLSAETTKVIGTVNQGTSPWVTSVTSVTPGTGATNLGKAEDAAHSSGDVGVFGLALANEAQIVLANDGDYIGHGTDTKGNTFVTGPVASGATDSGNPIKIGGRFNSAVQAFTNGQRADLQVDQRGGLLIQDGQAIPSVSVTSASTLFTVADTSGYGSVSVQVVSAGTTCTIIYEASEDGITWSGVSGWSISATASSTPSTTSTTTAQLIFPLYAKQFRARVSTYTSGTVTVQGTLRKDTIPKQAVLVSISGSATVVGNNGDGSAVAANGVGVLAEARTTNKTAQASGIYIRPIATSIGAAVNKPFQVPELDWSYPAAAGGISNTTTAVTMVGAAGAGIRNYLTAIQVSAGALGAASEIAVRDGAGGTVIWRGFLSTAGGNQSVNLSSPIKSTANTLLEVVTLTATITGAVYINAQGYQAP